MKRFIILISIILILFSNIGESANEFQFKEFVFGSSIEQTKDLIRSEGWHIESEFKDNTDSAILANGDLLGKKVRIIYSFTPISGKLFGIMIKFPEYSYSRIKSLLIDKYGNPEKCELFVEKCLWIDKNHTNIIHLRDDFDTIILAYSNKNLWDLNIEEKKKLDSKYNDDL